MENDDDAVAGEIEWFLTLLDALYFVFHAAGSLLFRRLRSNGSFQFPTCDAEPVSILTQVIERVR